MVNNRYALHSLIASVTLLIIACSTPSPSDLFQLPAPSTDAGQPSVKDVGPIRLVDSGSGANQPERVIFPNERALMVDFNMRPSIGWAGILRTLENAEVNVSYRRWFPHITESDVDGRYGLVIVAGGSGPGDPSPLMRPASVNALTQFVQQGGSVLFATAHGWADRRLSQNETYRFNEVLEGLEVPARIESNTLIGDIFLPAGDGPPLHSTRPWAYVTSLEWSIGLPVAFPGPDLRGRESLDALALGWSASISCAGADVQVLTRAHVDVYSWDRQDGEETFSVPSEALPVAVLAPAGHGSVALIPRSILEMPFHSSVGADQPILEPSLLEQTEAMGGALVEAWLENARVGSSSDGDGCFSGQMPLYNPSEHAPPPLLYSVRPVPETPSQPLWLRERIPEPVPRTTPAWFRGVRGRLAYGELAPPGRMNAVITRMLTSNMDGLTAHLPASLLIDYDPSHGISEVMASAAQYASDANTFLALAAHYRNVLYEDARDQVGPAIGVYERRLDAPPPLSDLWWQSNLRPLLVGAAQATADHIGLSGLVLDLELYGAGSLTYSDGYIFDEETWSHVIELISNRDAALGAEASALSDRDRLAWLVDGGLIGFVYQELEDEVALRAGDALAAARAINPNFELLLYVHAAQTGWYYRGLMRGFGTRERPVALLSYDQNTTHLTTALRADGLSVLGLSGVLAVRLRAQDAETALYHAGLSSDGPWMFQTSDFPDTGPDEVAPPRHDPIDDYWSAFGRANDRLESLE